LRRAHELDRSLMRRAARGSSPGRDQLIVAIGKAANYSRLWLVIAAPLLLFGDRAARRGAVRGLVAVAIAAVVANGPAKLLVRRRRPTGFGPTLIRMPRSTSFPSGHSATAFAFAAGVSLESPRLAPALVPLAATVAFSRVRTGVHYPSDVLAGAAIGIGSAIASGPLSRRLLPARPDA
jgi:undecaprenyl-diphosphatase